MVTRYLSSSGLSHKETVGSPLRGVGSTLSPSCRLYEPEAGLEALRAASGSYRHDPTPRREAETESWSQTPVVSCPLAISQTELLLSDTLHRVSFHLRQSKAYPTDHNYTPACHRLSFHVLYGSWLLAMAGKYFGAPLIHPASDSSCEVCTWISLLTPSASLPSSGFRIPEFRRIGNKRERCGQA